MKLGVKNHTLAIKKIITPILLISGSTVRGTIRGTVRGPVIGTVRVILFAPSITGNLFDFRLRAEKKWF